MYAQRSKISVKLRFILIKGYGDNVGESEGSMDGANDELGTVNSEGLTLTLG